MTTTTKPRLRNQRRESPVGRGCLLVASRYGARLWRNNVGLFFTADGRPVRCGLCKGSSDYIGITRYGRFLAVETKRPKGGVVSADQQHFICAVRAMGGVAVIAHSPDDLERVLRDELPIKPDLQVRNN
jgi:hypothetical protein